MNNFTKSLFLILCLVWLMPTTVEAQRKKKKKKEESKAYKETLYKGAITWRNIGPFRGGRSAAVTGVPGKPNLFYFGAAGGGVGMEPDIALEEAEGR